MKIFFLRFIIQFYYTLSLLLVVIFFWNIFVITCFACFFQSWLHFNEASHYLIDVKFMIVAQNSNKSLSNSAQDCPEQISVPLWRILCHWSLSYALSMLWKFFDVFRGCRRRTVAWNGYNIQRKSYVMKMYK